MPRKLREYPCADCGRTTRRDRRSNEPWICADCGRRRQSDAARRTNARKLAYDAARKPEIPEPRE